MSWNDASEYVFPSTAGREKSGAAAPIGSPSYFTSSKEPPRSPIRAVDIGFRSRHPSVSRAAWARTHRLADFKTQTLSPSRRMQHSRDCVKYVIVTGGVLSGLGKGISTSSIGVLLKSKGLKVCPVKIDPYLNVDAGTMNPYQHGEVFVLDDGSEVDLDLGTSERFLDVNLTGDHNITTGKVSAAAIAKQRRRTAHSPTAEIPPQLAYATK